MATILQFAQPKLPAKPSPPKGYNPSILATLCEIAEARRAGDTDGLEGLQVHLRLEISRQIGVPFGALQAALNDEVL